MILPEKKLKCACCCKFIPVGRVFVIEKAVDGLQECKINHLCAPCDLYTTKLRRSEQVNAVLRSMIY